MRTLLRIAVFVIVPLTFICLARADDNPVDVTDSVESVPVAAVSPVTPVTPVSASKAKAQLPLPAPPNGFAQYRMIPTYGDPGTPTFGSIHYDGPMRSYTEWYRPRAHELTRCLRCATDDFKPKGFGHLFARPRCSYRMDYAPYVLRDSYTQYGPAYIRGQGDQRCDKQCGLCSGNGCQHCMGD